MAKVAQIIPIKKLPRQLDCLDYYIPASLESQIKPGVFVNIPFKKQTIQGIVREIKTKTEYSEAKEILSLNERLGQTLPYQLALIEWFSGYYYFSLGSTAKMMFPDVLKRRVNVSPDEATAGQIRLAENKKIASLARQLFKSNDKKFLLFPYDAEWRDLLYMDLCEKAIERSGQILILLPTRQKLSEFVEKLSNALRRQAVVLTAELHASKARYFRAWDAIRKNEKKIIIGTRSAIFAPLIQPEIIIIDAAHADDYKQWDMTPRYETVRVAQKIQELTGCKLILSSLSPRIEDACEAKAEKYKLISLGAKNQDKVVIVDLKQERKNDFTYLSEKMLAAIRASIAVGKRALLIVNKKGEYSYFFCEDCHYEACCPECELPLTVDGSNLVCFRCGTRKQIFLECPNCHGANLKRLGIGVDQIKRELEKLFPGQNNIEVSTGQGLDEKSFLNLGLLGFVYVDSLVYLADFNSNFKLFSFQQELIQRLRRFFPEGQVIVQTCFPENLAFASLNQGYDHFYRQEIESRKQFGYPPFRTLIKLFFQHHDLAVCKKEAFDLYEKMKKLASFSMSRPLRLASIRQSSRSGRTGGETGSGQENRKVKIIEPYLHYTQKVRNRYRYQLVAFLDDVNQREEQAIFKPVPEYWTIDKNPIDLL